MEWVAADLAAVKAAGQTDWILCQYHHPPHSDGSHKSDTELEMVEMRQLYNPILEAGGVDICFHGHSHGYERMLPTAGFFGNQSTYVPATHNAAGYTAASGSTAATHIKPVGLSANAGTTYVVAGSGGQFTASSGSNYRYASTAISNATASNAGSLGIDIIGNVLTLSFIAGGSGTAAAGAIADTFLICKGSCTASPSPVPGAASPPPGAAVASPPPPPPSPPVVVPSGSKAYVSATVTLAGYTAATFGAAQAAQFATVMAAQLGNGVASSDITITSVTNVAAGRRSRELLQTGGVSVAFTVATSSAAASTAVSGAIVTATSNGAALVTALQAGGLTAASGVALTAQPSTAVSTTAPAPAPSLAAPAASAGAKATACIRMLIAAAMCVVFWA
jgi:hypothetical protein